MHASLPLLLSAALFAPQAQDSRPAAPPSQGQGEARLAQTIEHEAAHIARALSEIVQPTFELARVKAVEARELASEVETFAAQAAQAGREAFLAGREAYELAIASNQDPEERITRALQSARAEVERLQAELERSRVTRRLQEVRQGAERIRLETFDREELHELRRRIEEQLHSQGQHEGGAERARRFRVAGEPGGEGRLLELRAELREPGAASAPAVRNLRMRRAEAPSVEVQVERLNALGYAAVPQRIEIEVEESPEDGGSRAVRVAPHPARGVAPGQAGAPTASEPAQVRAVQTESRPAVEILRLGERLDGVERPARIIVRTSDGGVRVLEAEGLEMLETMPVYPPPPMPPTAAAPRAGRVALAVPATPIAPAAPTQDSQAALEEVTNLVREMVSEVRDLRASLEELRAQVQGRGGR